MSLTNNMFQKNSNVLYRIASALEFVCFLLAISFVQVFLISHYVQANGYGANYPVLLRLTCYSALAALGFLYLTLKNFSNLFLAQKYSKLIICLTIPTLLVDAISIYYLLEYSNVHLALSAAVLFFVIYVISAYFYLKTSFCVTFNFNGRLGRSGVHIFGYLLAIYAAIAPLDTSKFINSESFPNPVDFLQCKNNLALQSPPSLLHQKTGLLLLLL